MKSIGEKIDINDVSITNKSDFLNIIRDEFKMIISDGGVLLIVVFAMLIYTTIYSLAYGSEVVERVSIAVIDNDNSTSSRTVINGLRSGPNTEVCYEVENMSEAKHLFYSRDIFGIVVIPSGFERDIIAGTQTNISTILDGSHLLLYKQVLEQTTEDVLTYSASVEAMRLVACGANDIESEDIIQPVAYEWHILNNPSMGYGSFVMPSIIVVIIQQTLLIGLGMLGVRRRTLANTQTNVAMSVFAKLLVYIAIYGINLIIILGVLWPLFGFPYNGKTIDVIVVMMLYIIASSALALTISHLFKRREAPLMLLLWSSIPILLLAGVSYPMQAFPKWLYLIGRVFPSSSAVNAYVNIGTAGASLSDVATDIYTLLALAILYIITAIVMEYKYLLSYRK